MIAAELGDYDADVHTLSFISQFHFVPRQTAELEAPILDQFQLCRSSPRHSYTTRTRKSLWCWQL